MNPLLKITRQKTGWEEIKGTHPFVPCIARIQRRKNGNSGPC
jgi:hypothetical protein